MNKNSFIPPCRAESMSRENRCSLPVNDIAAFKVAACALACVLCSTAQAQDLSTTNGPPNTSVDEPVLLPAAIVEGRDDSLIGIAEAASQGTVGADQLIQRAISRPGEVLETVPGLILTQHSGAGKANQFFLRGFNLDHGTDFATSIDGVPVNLPTHGHGQGYTDLNFLIPELVERVDFLKGPYYAELGDFASAGGADLQYFNVLEQSIAQLEGGSFGYARGLFLSSPHVGAGHLLYGMELFHNDGPWEHPDDYQRINGVLRYSQGDASLGWSVTAMAYAGDWDSTDQIAARALERPGFGRFDSLNTSDGGDSQRYSLSAEWHRGDERSATKLMVYGFYYDLDLFSDFTYFLSSPQGDQFEQKDQRWVGGTKASHTWFGHLGQRDMENTLGLEIRSDSIENGLFQTVRRQRTDKLDYAGEIIPAVTRSDDIWETSISPYVENKMQWGEKLRSVLGLRADFYHFEVEGNDPVNSGSEDDAMVSPKGSFIFGPWAQTELYLSGGLGFHSNDGRGVTSPEDPADPLVRTYGAEVGARTAVVPGLQSTLALWWLDIDSELVFVGDAGETEASRPSRRYGVEFANYYTPNPWLTFDADVSFSHAEFRDDDPAGDHIPGAVASVVAAGITLQQPGGRGFFAGLRLRYFGPRPLIEDDSVRSPETILMSARVGYRFNKHWTLSAEVFNLLDRKDSEIDYYYPSRLSGEPAGPDEGGYNDRHFKPVDPISVRLAVTARF
jgi:outer membrane receptor protein involved in Fe transport